MKVLYDYGCFVQLVGGVSRYHVELIKNAPSDVNYILQPLLSSNVYLDEIGSWHKDLLPMWKSGFKENVKKQLNQWLSMAYLHMADYDIFHATGLNPYFVGHTDKPVVITVHDLIHEKYPDMIEKSKVVCAKRRRQLDRADAIICISNQTKDDLLTYYPDIDDKKISVIYHGVNQEPVRTEKTRMVEAPYLLYVGGRKTYKNFARFVEAFGRLDSDIHLVCTGTSFSSGERELLRRSGLDRRAHQMFVTESQLENLYANAVAFVYPSQCEGFGLPILEAFRCKCPCVISDIGCFREVAGDGAMYFDPLDVDDMTDVLRYALDNQSALDDNRAIGTQRLPYFNWANTAALHKEAYNRALR